MGRGADGAAPITDGGRVMASERVKMEWLGGQYRVILDGVEKFRSPLNFAASLIAEGVAIGLSAAPDLVADTARALDEDQDDPEVAGVAPPVPFKVGDRLKDWADDICTVVAVRDDGFDVLYDDRRFGDRGFVSPGGYWSHKYTILPRPCRPDTADGEVPEGWREDCYGDLFARDGSSVFYEKNCRHWTAFDVKTLGSRGPKYFALRSEAIARLQELLGEGGGR